jgi:alpha-tubulin suppressor-like RCC1 family protein
VTGVAASSANSSSGSLPAVELRILDAEDVCERELARAGVVGSAGGVAVSADGSAGIAVPGGAMTEDGLALTIELSAATPPAEFGTVVSPVYDFGPDGLGFSKPARLTLSFDPTLLAADGDPNTLRIAFEDGGDWLGVPTTVDTASRTATAAVFHFSDFAVVCPAEDCPHDPSLPNPITELTAAQSGQAITVSWTPPVMRYAYAEIRRADDASGPFSLFAHSSRDATSFVDTAPLGETTCYEVRSVSEHGFVSDPANVCAQSQASGVAAVSAGVQHTCAMTAAGGVKCWGNNSAGLLGDGTTDQRLTAVDVVGLTSGVAAVSAGSFAHTCALTTAGGVKCWGNNNVGQLGDGTTTERLTPVDVVGLTSGVVAIDVGEAHTCALTTVGGVKCWGQNFAGHLGDGTTTERLTPVDVAGLTSGVVAVSAGQFHTCAVTTTGGIKCWGNNNSGQLGDGTTIEQLTAVDVSGLTSGVAAVSAGQQHTCAITNSGGLKCWGTNFAGQLGDGTTTERLTPADVTGLTSGVAAVTADASSSHTCALTTAGGVKCWGRNTLGQLGAGIPTNRLTPADVLGL